jgi:hypothetical protein
MRYGENADKVIDGKAKMKVEKTEDLQNVLW